MTEEPASDGRLLTINECVHCQTAAHRSSAPLCTRGRDHLYHLWCTMIFHDVEKALTIPSDRPLEGF